MSESKFGFDFSKKEEEKEVVDAAPASFEPKEEKKEEKKPEKKAEKKAPKKEAKKEAPKPAPAPAKKSNFAKDRIRKFRG